MPDNRNLWDSRQDRAERHPILYAGLWVLGITVVALVVVGFVGVVSTGSVFFKSGASNAMLGSRENIVRNSTGNATSSIAYFHDQCQGVNRQIQIYHVNEARYKRLAAQATAAASVIEQHQAEGLAQNAADDADGALNAAIATAADYNAKAANSLTAKFREAGLPDRIALPDDPSTMTPIDCG